MTEEKAVTTMTEEGVPVLTLEPLEQTALAEPAPAEVEPMLTEDTLTPEERKMVEDFAATIDVSNSNVFCNTAPRRKRRSPGFLKTLYRTYAPRIWARSGR